MYLCKAKSFFVLTKFVMSYTELGCVCLYLEYLVFVLWLFLHKSSVNTE